VPSKALTIGLAAALGVICGVVTAFALPGHVEDPLHLGGALVNQQCKPGQSVVMLASGKPTSRLTSMIASNPGARYLQTSKSCQTTWRYQAPGETSVRPDPEYVVYLGPFATNPACEIRMQGAHKGAFVTMLTAGTPDMVQCICHVNLVSAPTLRPNMTNDATDSIWIRQLQSMFRDAHLLPDVTGLYDQATQDVVRAEQAKYDPQASGIVDSTTWSHLTGMCSRYE
jgi:hypothetical protein